MRGATFLHGTVSYYCNFLEDREGSGIGDPKQPMELKGIERYAAFEKKDGG